MIAIIPWYRISGTWSPSQSSKQAHKPTLSLCLLCLSHVHDSHEATGTRSKLAARVFFAILHVPTYRQIAPGTGTKGAQRTAQMHCTSHDALDLVKVKTPSKRKRSQRRSNVYTGKGTALPLWEKPFSTFLLIALCVAGLPVVNTTYSPRPLASYPSLRGDRTCFGPPFLFALCLCASIAHTVGGFRLLCSRC